MKTIKASFNKLIGGQRSLDRVAVTSVANEIQKAIFRHPAEGSEVIKAFNSVLKGVFAHGPHRPVFNGDESAAWHARCTAAVFLALAREGVVLEDSLSIEPRPWGWDSLNSDAKGWCLTLLECDPPAHATPELIRLLGLAKDDVRGILRLTKRRGERSVERSDLTELVE